VGVGWWVSGNVVEVGLLAGLFLDAAQTRSVRSVIRAATPLVVERMMVSGSNASSAFMSASLLTHRVPASSLYGLATLVAATRLVLRVHHPSDVAVGAVAGVAIGRALNTWAPIKNE